MVSRKWVISISTIWYYLYVYVIIYGFQKTESFIGVDQTVWTVWTVWTIWTVWTAWTAAIWARMWTSDTRAFSISCDQKTK